MTGLTLFWARALKVLSRAYTLRVVVVGDEELRNVTVAASGVDVVLDVDVSSWAGIEAKGLETVDALRTVLALGLEFGLGLEKANIHKVFLRQGLGGVYIEGTFGSGGSELNLKVFVKLELGASQSDKSEVSVLKRNEAISTIRSAQSKRLVN